MHLASCQSDLQRREAPTRGLERRVNSSSNAPGLSDSARNMPVRMRCRALATAAAPGCSSDATALPQIKWSIKLTRLPSVACVKSVNPETLSGVGTQFDRLPARNGEVHAWHARRIRCSHRTSRTRAGPEDGPETECLCRPRRTGRFAASFEGRHKDCPRCRTSSLIRYPATVSSR